MKNLILIRHAKSNWEATASDLDRPLSRKGITDAFSVSDAINKYLPKKFIVWSSIAKRAKETAIIYAQNLSIPLDTIIFKEELYTFDEDHLERTIKDCDNKYSSIVLFGHNEAITNFVNKFGDETFDTIPTSGFVSISFNEDDWGFIKNGKVVKTVFPRHLKE
ncbi:MAG: histidine phosphatase family protein [Flavobacterium sp.]|nr:histidine phosphatase family protein [Candidatus Neoflavobacterium equi]